MVVRMRVQAHTQTCSSLGDRDHHRRVPFIALEGGKPGSLQLSLSFWLQRAEEVLTLGKKSSHFLFQ